MESVLLIFSIKNRKKYLDFRRYISNCLISINYSDILL